MENISKHFRIKNGAELDVFLRLFGDFGKSGNLSKHFPIKKRAELDVFL